MRFFTTTLFRTVKQAKAMTSSERSAIALASSKRSARTRYCERIGAIADAVVVVAAASISERSARVRYGERIGSIRERKRVNS